jgi:hypothetical protein
MRATSYPQIPAELVNAILDLETEHVADRSLASEKVAAEIQHHVSTKAKP